VHRGRRAALALASRTRSGPPRRALGTAARPALPRSVGARRRPGVRAADPIARTGGVLLLLWRRAEADPRRRPDLGAAPRARFGRVFRRARRATRARASAARHR